MARSFEVFCASKNHDILRTDNQFINNTTAPRGLEHGAGGIDVWKKIYIHFPLIILSKNFQLLGGRVVSIFSVLGFSPVVFLFLPPLIQGKIQDCVLYQPTALPKLDTGFAHSSELISETLSVIVIRRHSETCLASGSTYNFETPIRLVGCCNCSSYLLNASFGLHMILCCKKQRNFSISCS